MPTLSHTITPGYAPEHFLPIRNIQFFSSHNIILWFVVSWKLSISFLFLLSNSRLIYNYSNPSNFKLSTIGCFNRSSLLLSMAFLARTTSTPTTSMDTIDRVRTSPLRGRFRKHSMTSGEWYLAYFCEWVNPISRNWDLWEYSSITTGRSCVNKADLLLWDNLDCSSYSPWNHVLLSIWNT